MMTLEAYHASANLDVDGAETSFNGFSLLSYPGGNMNIFATDTLWILKVMGLNHDHPHGFHPP